MTTAKLPLGLPRRAARLGFACAALLAAVPGASAEEGIGGLLSSIFGAPPQVAAPVADYAPPASVSRPSVRDYARHRRPRTLTVRLHPARPRIVAQAPVNPGKVSIFEDRTLRRGDAVMMASGVRVFVGSSSFPYTTGDFVPLKDSRAFDRDASRQLAQLDKVPRG